jgi:hypothetical protein
MRILISGPKRLKPKAHRGLKQNGPVFTPSPLGPKKGIWGGVLGSAHPFFSFAGHVLASFGPQNQGSKKFRGLKRLIYWPHRPHFARPFSNRGIFIDSRGGVDNFCILAGREVPKRLQFADLELGRLLGPRPAIGHLVARSRFWAEAPFLDLATGPFSIEALNLLARRAQFRASDLEAPELAGLRPRGRQLLL